MTVLLIPALDAHFVELSRVARMLATTGIYTPVFWFPSSYPALEKDLATCRSEGWKVLWIESPSKLNPSRSYSLVKQYIRMLPIRVSFWIFFAILYRKRSGEVKSIEEKSRSLIREIQPVLLLISEENVGESSYIASWVGREQNIPVVVVPYTVANATEAAEAYYDSFDHDVFANWVNRWVAKKYPQWVYEYKGKSLLRLPAWNILIMEGAGYHPARPWVLNSEPGTIVAVENERMLEYYKAEGLASEQLIVTGAIYDDVLAESASRSKEMRRKLVEELSLQEGYPILLCALPPSQFPRDCEFLDYISLVSFWMETLSRIVKWNVVIRPHPRLTDEKIRQIEHFGLKVSNWDTATLVPLCELYVASVSATIRWAIACGKPVVNYDVYQMKYADYKDVGGVLTVFSKDDFKNALNRFTTDREYYETMANNQRREMSKWGRLDGKSSERMLNLFDDVIAGKTGRVES